IFDWVSEFVAAERFSGQAGFDFIEGADGSLYCIECNPRSTSGIMMFRPHNDVPSAFFGDNDHLIVPDSDVDRMIGLGMLLYGWTKA
ncbi:carboxylate--amine ligase, partial [Mycobacterium tuberculosis]|nr:carboxylate--amine ligase [Mycobacterium tuberculosis]